MEFEKMACEIYWPLALLASVIQLLGITIMTFYKIVFYKSRPHIIQNDKKHKRRNDNDVVANNEKI